MHKILEELNVCPDCGEAESLICSSCGREFARASKQRPRFCSNACKQKAYRGRKKLACLPLAEFRQQKRWVRAREKRPLQLNGSYASSTNPETWATFDQIQSSSVGDGFGVMLGSVNGGAGIGCYDFDNCVKSGDVQPWVVDVIRKIPEPILFAELSVSGRGIHVFVKAPPTKGQRVKLECGNSYEKYTSARFIRCTFNADIPELTALAMKSKLREV